MAPIPSAAVVLLRDTPEGPEVFLVRRHSDSDVLGGAYVFPGGKLDERDTALVDRLDLPMALLHKALGEPDLSGVVAGALYVSAIRELFEETGVLLAAVDGAVARDAWAAARRGQRFDEVLSPVEAPLATSHLTPWSRWITPIGSVMTRKRFDARFFVATLPTGQEPVHDGHEATEGVWWSPKRALRNYLAGQIQLAPPQIMSLLHLVRYASVAGVLTDARSRIPAFVQPEVVEQAGERIVCFPGDEFHSVREHAVPGPTRLRWRGGRFEPEAGVDLERMRVAVAEP
jgi:8-oxo-dGTP pyrophosphatase MutT (NUDIX family)